MKKSNLILKGIAASHGVARGAVKIVRDVKNLKNLSWFNDGDILVAEVTEPSMVIFMNKASGIITNEGGITSHAAIVSRELGIPCITNVKNATKILKNGMIVEVDGKAGTVKIIFNDKNFKK